MHTPKQLYLLCAVALVAGLLPLTVTAVPPTKASTGPDSAKVEALVLEELATNGQTDFIVWMTEKADLSPAAALHTKAEKGRFVYDTLVATANRTQADLRRTLDAERVTYEAFYIANKILVRNGNQALLTTLAARSDVAQITANHKFQLQEPFKNADASSVPTGIESNVTFIKAPQVWAMGYTGQGTVMAGNDTGLDWDHPAIINKYRGWNGSTADHNYNWWDATGTFPAVPDDGHGHGTHTTGTMVGDDGGSNQIGVAPGAQTIHCKNMTNSGSGSDATFTTCFQWDLAPWDLNHQNPDPSKAPDAINNSWGYSGGGQNQFRDEIQALHAAGILVEVSSGNEGSSCSSLRSPGDYWEVLTTGSVNHAYAFPGTMTDFSSRGPSDLDGNYFPDISAPGENIRSSVPGGGYEGGWSGTSMAGPHATALVGLMWSACPSLQGMVYETIDIIVDTASPVTSYVGSCGGDYVTGPNNDWGYGTIDSVAAVQQAIAQCVGSGTLDGTVTDSSTGLPLEGVAITAVWAGGGTWNDTTDAAGYYNMTVPIGLYDITAAKFAYISETALSVEVFEDTTTTQNFALDPAPQFAVSGTVKDAVTNAPLYAQVEVVGIPVTPVWTDPGTGAYSIDVPAGSYTFRASAASHQPVDQPLVVDGDETLNFLLPPLPCILLVDDDNNAPDTLPYFTAALDTMGLDYDVFDTGGGNGPDLAGLSGYNMVFWFSGDLWGGTAGPSSTDETNLAAYLDAGGNLFLSSQDYLYDVGLTTFGSTYLGIGSYSDDSGNATAKVGVAGDPIGNGLGPFSLTYPAGFSDYGDVVTAGAGASQAFKSSSGVNLDVDKAGGAWKTVFFGTDWVPIYNNNAANGITVLQRIVDWFGGCEPPCNPPSGADFTWTPATPYLGQVVSFSGNAAGTAPISYAWTFGDGDTGAGQAPTHTYTTPGTYVVTMTASNACGSQAVQHSITVVNSAHLFQWNLLHRAARPPLHLVHAMGTVHDQNHNLVAGITVTGIWTYPDGTTQAGTSIAPSGADGRWTIRAIKPQCGLYQFDITGMSGPGHTYNPADNHVGTHKEITVPCK